MQHEPTPTSAAATTPPRRSSLRRALRAAAWTFGGLLTLVLAPQFLSFWPSPVDWKLALRSWPYLLIIAAAAIAWCWFHTSLFRFVKA